MTQPAMMSEADHDRVTRAVAAAEATSPAEIVTIVAEQSDSYADIALLCSALAAFLALCLLAVMPGFYLELWDRLTGAWGLQSGPRSLFEMAALFAMLKFAGVWLILLWRPLRILLIPAPIRHDRVRARAITCFKVGADRRTTGRTGILIYLSMREHRAEIVADEGISSLVDPGVWGDAMAAMLGHIRQGRVADGMIAAIENVGAVVAQHLPPAVGDVNELPDRVIEV